MKNHQISSNVTETEKNKPTSFIKNVGMCILLAAVFAVVTAVVVLIARQTSTLKTDAQKLLYPLLSGVLLSSMTVRWV